MKDTTLEPVDFKQQEIMPGAISTLNQTGFVFTELSDVSKQYITFSKACTRVLDVGCAYGISVIPVLDYQTTEVFAVDLSAEHLESLVKAAGFKVEYSCYFTLKTLALLKHANNDSPWIGMIINKKTQRD